MIPIVENSSLGVLQSFPRHRILLVDEDEEDLRHFTSMLDGMGYSVQAFSDYRQVEACLKGGYFDLVIMCQTSPILETSRLSRLTVGHNRYTPVVVLSRLPEIKCYVEAMQCGASDYLEKPLSPAALEKLLATYCKPHQVG